MHDPYLYDEWAGQPRSVPIEKQEAILGYTSIEYTKPQAIETEAIAALQSIVARPRII